MDSCFRHKNAEFVRILRFLSIAYRKNTTILVHMPLKWGYDTALNIINIHLFPSRFKTSDCLEAISDVILVVIFVYLN